MTLSAIWTFLAAHTLTSLELTTLFIAMTGKCVHKGCEKTFEDPEEDCTYHPGPPIFHEGQKGV